ncbi:PR-1-like protein [Neocallimastix lanati (nom. inval.)]|uniref:PR-1-like protein n=1 Tax=Neocallimastix californiae TaxID=1754190 RepID=A0A1Y2FJ12_9FUNG|nr:PR-1-like protein [Neocallimastix sp. JGI-2020a]ORY82795.1 PR-1-like protein [Neocallimastix californiae]|eukprot:ORY82795.1 PR-1-like protein [Neocallimastix californiae]
MNQCFINMKKMRFNISAVLSIAFLVCSTNAKLTSSQKDALLSLHKEARAKLNASNMKSISWSDSLASAAQSYSEKCLGMVHSHKGPENLAGSTTGDVKRMFNNWMDEKSGFNNSGYRSNFKDISYHGEDIGHYSQIVWADNTEVGCGMTDCPHYSARYLLVCRYKTGNVIGREVYALGSGSSSDKDESRKTTTKKSTTSAHRSSTTRKTTTTTTTTTTVAAATNTPAVSVSEGIKVPTATVAANNTLNNNSTLTETPGITIPINDQNTNKDNKKEDDEKKTDNKKDEENIVEEVGPSSYTTDATTYVTGVAVTGSVVGAAAAFVFLKKNPKQYKQLTDNMKTISRSITKKANSVKRSATTVTSSVKRSATNVTRKITTKVRPTQSDSSNPFNGSSYRYEFTQNLS